MKTIKEAVQLIQSTPITGEVIEVDLLDSLGYVLVEDVLSPIDLPLFDQSAMDGYAVSGKGNTFSLLGETKAGDKQFNITLKEGEAIRIFTGAMIPEGTTSIAKQEIVEVQDGTIVLQEDLKEGVSIRRKGEELPKGSLAIAKGVLINSAAIGLLSSLGITKVKVWRKPAIEIVVSGNELTGLGEKLEEGKIYESNSYTLQASLKAINLEGKVNRVQDDFNKTVETISKALLNSDVVIITGGISVGDYDYVKAALEQLEVEEVFYKLKQKPGKPIFYGKKGNKRVFALPGNPAAVLTCFYMYVIPTLNMMMGKEAVFLNEKKAVLQEDFQKKGDRGFLLKGIYKDGKVKVSKGQSSAMLSSFVDANCLIHIEGEGRLVPEGELVNLYMIR